MLLGYAIKLLVRPTCHLHLLTLLLIFSPLKSSSLALFKPLNLLLYIHALAHNFPRGSAQNQPFILLVVDWCHWRVKCLAQGHVHNESREQLLVADSLSFIRLISPSTFQYSQHLFSFCPSPL